MYLVLRSHRSQVLAKSMCLSTLQFQGGLVIDLLSGFLPITMRVDKMTNIAKYFIEIVLYATFPLRDSLSNMFIGSQTYLENTVHGQLSNGDKTPDSQSRKGAEKSSSLILSFHRWGNKAK